MSISIVFSFFLYHLACQQIIKLIQAQHTKVKDWNKTPALLNFQDQENAETPLKYYLILINLGILIIAGGGGYFLAGRTLHPIKDMVDEQTQFISNASHQLRTPIATLRAEMEGSLLEKNISDQKARKLITSNLEEVETLQSLSNRLLKLAQLHNGKLDNYKQSISLGEIIKISQKKVTPLARKKQITIKVSGNKQPQTIHGVKDDLVELFVILLDNAIKYSQEKKQILVTIQTQEDKIQTLVSDQGVGILPNDLPHIYNRFYRSDTANIKNDGFGLGLSIAKKIIDTHKGIITVKSQLGKGTTFCIELPIVNVHTPLTSKYKNSV